MKEIISFLKVMGEILYNSSYQLEYMRDGIKFELEIIKQYFK